ncbi:MAG: hypothetical protein M1140_11805 [Chloroflexi bacterium]|nr:hypothetical protein [Chloroflexota bacterium]
MRSQFVVLSSVVMFALAACTGAQASAPTSAPTTAAPTETAAPAATNTAAPTSAAAMTDTMAMTGTTVLTGTLAMAQSTPLTPDQVVSVSMTNFTFAFTPTQISAGVVKFIVQNNSSDQIHEILIFKTDLPVDKLPLQADGTSVDETSSQITKVASVEDVDPGKGGEMTAKLDPGHYVYFCNTTGHYKLGMAGEFTIPASGMVAFTPVTMSASMGMTTTESVTPTESMTPSAELTPTEVVTVDMTNYAFKFTPSTVHAGVVKFVVVNDATDQMHEMWLVKTDLALDKLPLASDGSSIDENSTQFTKLGSVEDVNAGASGAMIVTLEPGRYVYFCNKPGHYKLGMAGEMNVVP